MARLAAEASAKEVAPPEPFRSIWFDCDSTLSAIEGIDELAALRDAKLRAEIVALTTRAMAGEIPLAQVYGLRLARIGPTRAECDGIGALYVERLLPDAPLVLAALRASGKKVGILSGGLLPAVLHLAEPLGIDRDRVLAVDISFHPDGSYQGFDEASPLAQNLGKPTVLARQPARDRPLAMVGDGGTDLETVPVVDRFVGFGGVVRRPQVADAAAFYAVGPGLTSVLPFLLTRTERERLRQDPRFASLDLE